MTGVNPQHPLMANGQTQSAPMGAMALVLNSLRRSARGAEEAFHYAGGRSSAGPARPSARPKPPLSIRSTLPSPLLFSRQVPLLAQSYLEEQQEHNCAKTEGDQRNGEHLAGQPTDHAGADQTSDNERRGQSKCQDPRAGRHRPKVSLRLTPERSQSPRTTVPLREMSGTGARVLVTAAAMC
jgi:hypothetical protein